jgi:hypothetical protein
VCVCDVCPVICDVMYVWYVVLVWFACMMCNVVCGVYWISAACCMCCVLCSDS